MIDDNKKYLWVFGSVTIMGQKPFCDWDNGLFLPSEYLKREQKIGRSAKAAWVESPDCPYIITVTDGIFHSYPYEFAPSWIVNNMSSYNLCCLEEELKKVRYDQR